MERWARSQCDTLWYGVVGGQIHLCSLTDGTIVDRVQCRQGQVKRICHDVALVRGVGLVEAIDRRKGPLWQRESALAGATAAHADSFVIAEDSGAAVTCLDSMTGSERRAIRIAPKAASREIRDLASLPTGFPSLTLVDNGLLLVRSRRTPTGRLRCGVSHSSTRR
jgi:hypothetical protein